VSLYRGEKLPDNVFFDAVTRWGTVRINVEASKYDKATATYNGLPDKRYESLRSSICIQIKSRLNEKGANISWVKWQDVEIANFSTVKPKAIISPAQNIKASSNKKHSQPGYSSERLFEDVEPTIASPNKAADEICGCVPFSAPTKGG